MRSKKEKARIAEMYLGPLESVPVLEQRRQNYLKAIRQAISTPDRIEASLGEAKTEAMKEWDERFVESLRK
jgi:glutamine synthetase type III